MSVLFLAHNTPQCIIDGAKRAGINTVILPPADGMAEPVASHPDMLMYAGFGRIFVRACHENTAAAVADAIKRFSLPYALSLTSDSPSDTYPSDVAFDCLMLGGALVGKVDSISHAVKRAAAESSVPVLDVKQGYAKCSSCVFGGSLVTADKSIYTLAEDRGMGAYKIESGHISLPGYGTGFIGGASFFADGKLYFLGDVTRHPSYGVIKSAADTEGVNVVSLSDGELFDAGCLYL